MFSPRASVCVLYLLSIELQVFIQGDSVDVIAAMTGGDAFLAEQAYQQRMAARTSTVEALADAEKAGLPAISVLKKGMQVPPLASTFVAWRSNGMVFVSDVYDLCPPHL